MLDLEYPHERYAFDSRGTVNQLVHLGILQPLHLKFAGIIPHLTNDWILDPLDCFPRFRLFENHYIIRVADVANALFIVDTWQSPASCAQVHRTSAFLTIKGDFHLGKLRHLANVYHRCLYKLDLSFRFLGIRVCTSNLNHQFGCGSHTLGAAPAIFRWRDPLLTNASSVVALVTVITDEHLLVALVEVLSITHLTVSVDKHALR